MNFNNIINNKFEKRIMINPRSIENTMKRMFFQDEVNHTCHLKNSINLEYGIRHRGRLGVLLYELKHIFLNIFVKHQRLRDSGHRDFIDEIANNFSKLNVENIDINNHYTLYRDSVNNCDIKLRKDSEDKYHIEICKNNCFFNKVQLFKRFCSQDLEDFVKESTKYIDNKTSLYCLRSHDIFGRINNNVLAVIINQISLSITSKFNDINIQDIVILLKYIAYNEKIDETVIRINYKYKIKMSYDDTNNTYTIKVIDNFRKESIIAVKTFTFYISQKSDKLILDNKYDFSIQSLKLETNEYMLNLLYKYLHQISSIDKLNIINCFLFNNDGIKEIESTSNKIKIKICKQGITLYYVKDCGYEVLYLYLFEYFTCLKEEVISILKSYTIYFGGTFESFDNAIYMVDKKHDIHSYKLELNKLILNKYFGYIYFKNINLLFYIKPKMFEQLNILAGEPIIRDNCINCEFLFRDKDIQSGNDLRSVLDQYLGFNLLLDGPNLTGSNIPKQLKKINKILKKIKPENKPIILSGYSQGSFLPLEIAKYNPDLTFIIILNAPTKGVSSYGILGKKKISYIPSNVKYLWVNYNGGIYPFFGHSIFKSSSDLDIRVDYYHDLNHYDQPWNIYKLNYGDILSKLQTKLKRNYCTNPEIYHRDENYYPEGTNDYYIQKTMINYKY